MNRMLTLRKETLLRLSTGDPKPAAALTPAAKGPGRDQELLTLTTSLTTIG